MIRGGTSCQRKSSQQRLTLRKDFHFSLLDDENGSIPSGNITFVMAFLIPVIILAALYYVRDIFPFGSNCYLRSDMYHQYAPFFRNSGIKSEAAKA